MAAAMNADRLVQLGTYAKRIEETAKSIEDTEGISPLLRNEAKSIIGYASAIIRIVDVEKKEKGEK